MIAKRKQNAALAGLAACIVMVLSDGCKETAGKTENTEGPDTAPSISVVTSVIMERPFEAWGSYSADLRGSDDAVLIAPNQGGRVNMIKRVGTRFPAGDALCDIDADKYEAA
ncbi:MAG: hypothetical protein JXA71_01710, partial [Chitinispirillaceae bacterium]|nr:hypothetical protein [Chitinispirillaceae bacterium]